MRRIWTHRIPSRIYRIWNAIQSGIIQIVCNNNSAHWQQYFLPCTIGRKRNQPTGNCNNKFFTADRIRYQSDLFPILWRDIRNFSGNVRHILLIIQCNFYLDFFRKGSQYFLSLRFFRQIACVSVIVDRAPASFETQQYKLTRGDPGCDCLCLYFSFLIPPSPCLCKVSASLYHTSSGAE